MAMKTVLETTDCSIAPPFEPVVPHTARVFLCPSCESPLEYERSHLENPGTPTDLIDYYRCPVGCGTFESERKRHRLRLLDAGDTGAP
jgi:hypothetical protein